jgi:xylan 1,4-beta-xylosidase
VPYLQIAGCCKHLIAYSFEGQGYSASSNRKNFDAIVDAHDLSETYSPAFRRCVQEGQPAQIMCSYNKLNGVPTCADPSLLNGLLRDTWGFDGLVVADCDAVEDVCDTHHYSNESAAVAETINAGCDQDCGAYTFLHGPAAVEEGLLDQDAVDLALQRVLEMRFKLGELLLTLTANLALALVSLIVLIAIITLILGEFDDAAGNPYAALTDTCDDEAQALALQAATEAIVLLNNSAGLLPLSAPDASAPLKVAVVGPLAQSSSVMWGAKDDFLPCFDTVSVWDGIQDVDGVEASYAIGCKGAIPVVGDDDGDDAGGGGDDDSTSYAVACATTDGFDEAAAAAAEADVVVAVVGVDGTVESEGYDRAPEVGIGLPGNQTALLQAIAAGMPDPSKLIVVMLNGGPVSSSWVRDNVATVLDAFEGGQAGGTALADVLFGKASPSGVMPFTSFPESYVDEVDIADMSMRPSPGRTYRYYTGETAPVWCFGAGGSYVDFDLAYSDESALPTSLATGDARAAALNADGGVNVTVSVTNTDTTRAAAKVVQLYVRAMSVDGIDDAELIPQVSLAKEWGPCTAVHDVHERNQI